MTELIISDAFLSPVVIQEKNVNLLIKMKFFIKLFVKTYQNKIYWKVISIIQLIYDMGHTPSTAENVISQEVLTNSVVQVDCYICK